MVMMGYAYYTLVFGLSLLDRCEQNEHGREKFQSDTARPAAGRARHPVSLQIHVTPS